MSIRWKLLALLLGLALLPLAVIGWFDHRALSDLGGTLAIQPRDALTAQLTRRLLEVVESEAAAMRDRGRRWRGEAVFGVEAELPHRQRHRRRG